MLHSDSPVVSSYVIVLIILAFWVDVYVLFSLNRWGVQFSYDAPSLLSTSVGVSQEPDICLTVWQQGSFRIRKSKLIQYYFWISSPYSECTNGPNNFLCRKSNLFFWPRIWSRLAVPLVIMPLWCPFICVCSWESVSWPWRFFKSTDWFLCKMFLSSGSSEVSSWLDSDHMFLAARPRKWYSFFSGSWDTSYQFVPFPVILTLILKMVSARFLFYRIPIFLLVIHK